MNEATTYQAGAGFAGDSRGSGWRIRRNRIAYREWRATTGVRRNCRTGTEIGFGSGLSAEPRRSRRCAGGKAGLSRCSRPTSTILPWRRSQPQSRRLCVSAGYVMILCDTHDRADLQDEYLNAMRSQVVQGYVVVNAVRSEALSAAVARGDPIVFVGRRNPDRGGSFVGIDNWRAGRMRQTIWARADQGACGHLPLARIIGNARPCRRLHDPP